MQKSVLESNQHKKKADKKLADFKEKEHKNGKKMDKNRCKDLEGG